MFSTNKFLPLRAFSSAFRNAQTPAKRNFHRCLGFCNTYSKQRAILKKIETFRNLKQYSTVEEDVLESFIKGMFEARIDMTWIFPFPSLESSKELNDFNDSMKPVQDFLAGKILNSAKMDQDAEIPLELIQELKKLSLFGMKIPQKYGGLGLSNLKYARLSEEIASADTSINMMLASHNVLGVQPILASGSEEQKKKYLPKMAAGEMIGAFCYNEALCGSDMTTMNTRATLSEDGKYYLISGEKTSINNGAIADVMVVFAQTEVVDVNGVKKDAITAFLVERDYGGIYNGPQEDKMGMRALNTCDVMFDDTQVPVANVLGVVGHGFRIAMETLNSGRLDLVTGIIGPTRKIVNKVTEYGNIRKQFGKPIKDFQMIREKIYKMSQNIYAMESMAYLTAGKYDQAVEEELTPDLAVESAATKIFCSQKAFENASECLQIIGYRGYLKNLPYERLLRDTRMLMISEGTTEVLMLYIALSGMQSVENNLTQRMRHLKMGTLRQRMTSVFDSLADRYGSEHTAHGILRKKIPSFGFSAPHQTVTWLDPRLSDCGKLLEVSVQSFYHKIYSLIQQFGNDINDEQLYLRRVAEITIHLYSMAAVISRCNKSLILGLRDREREYMLAVPFICSSYRKCKHLLEELKGTYTMDVDREAKRIGKELFEERRYLFAHPLELEHRYMEHPIYLDHLNNLKSLTNK